MSDARRPPGSAGADPQGSGGDAADPIFQKEEPKRRADKSTILLWQFFLFPVLIVAAAVGVFVLFGAVSGSAATPAELLDKVLTGGDNEQQQAAQQLAIEISRERRRVERGEDEDEPPFYADPMFRKKLHEAFRVSLGADGTNERRGALARALGRTQDPAAVALLSSVLHPGDGKEPFDAAVRREAAVGLLFMEDRAAEGALVRAAGDDDEQVRDIAYNALALLGLPKHGGKAADGPQVMPVLRKGLEDPMAGVRVNAAYALAVRGDPAGVPLLRRSLTRKDLQEMGIPPDLHAQALRNAIRGAAYLGDDELKVLVTRLSSTETEQDGNVRQIAREALARWSTD